jgi:hypothetical protein
MDLQVALNMRNFVIRLIETADSSFYMLKEENVYWTHLAQDRAKWPAVNVVMKVMNGDELVHSVIWYWVAEELVGTLDGLMCMEFINIWHYSI